MSNFIKDPTIIFALQTFERGVKSECDLAVLTKDLNKIAVKAPLYKNGRFNSRGFDSLILFSKSI
jgi:hypothetical protein